jgi:putative ABC transport system permease protein
MRLGAVAWRGLRARPLRTALAVIGVALGVAIVAATSITTGAADQAVRSAAAELLGRADVRLRAFDETGFTPRTVQTLRSLPGVEAAAAVAERRLQVTTDPGDDEQVFTLLVLGVDPAVEPEVRDPHLAAGVELSADSPTDALVPADWAARTGLSIGDGLLLSGRLPGAPPLRIVGLLDRVGFGALERGEVLVMSRQALDAAYDVPSPIRYLDLVVADDATVADLLADIDAVMTEPYVVETEDDAAARLSAAQANFSAIAFLFGLVALVVGAFMVGNTMAMLVGERSREIGLLRAAGTTSRQVLGIVARQAAAIAVGGSLLGLGGGVVLAAAMITFLASTRTALAAGLPLPAGGLVLAFSLGIGVTALGAAAPAIAAARLAPLEALRPSTRSDRGLGPRLRWLVAIELLVVALGLLILPLDTGDAPLLPIVLSLGLLIGGAVAAASVLQPLGAVIGRPFEWFFGAQGLLGRANLSRDRTRTGLSVGALMIALAAVVALGSVAESARAGAERWIESILPGGQAIRLIVPVDVEQFRPTLDATEGLLVASPVLEAPAIWATDSMRREVSLAGIDPNVFQDGGALIVRDGNRAAAFNALRDGGAVLVPDGMARRDGIAVGHTMRIGLPGQDPVELRVAGILEYTLPARSPDGALVISSADARDAFGLTTASLWAMVPEPGVPDATFSASVRLTAAELAGQALTAGELADELSRALDRLIGLFDALALVAVVIAAFGIVNTLAMGVTERVREIAILRSHGMTIGQVQAMVVTEAAIMGAIGGVLAIVTGLAVAWALVTAAAGEFGAGLVTPWSLLVAVVLLGTGVAAAAGLYPARLAAGLPIIPHLKRFE